MKGVDIDDDAFKYIEAIIGSMTPKERSQPDLINVSRKKRIAKGATELVLLRIFLLTSFSLAECSSFSIFKRKPY